MRHAQITIDFHDVFHVSIVKVALWGLHCSKYSENTRRKWASIKFLLEKKKTIEKFVLIR